MKISIAAVIGALTALAAPVTAYASCVPMTAAQQERRADVIFDGVALEGPTPTGLQHFRVVRYLKGKGPDKVSVATGVKSNPDGSGSTTSISVNVAQGERWRILGQRRPGGIVETSECEGSGKLASAGAGTKPSAASDRKSAGGTDTRTRAAILLGSLLLGGVALAVGMRRRRAVR